MNIKVMFDEKSVLRTLARLSHEIIEKNDDANELYIVGIRSRGVSIAKLLAENIKKFSDISVYLGELDISLHRDDIDKNKPTSSGTQTAGDDSEVALPSVGDIPAESEDEEPEPGSPQTGESSLRLTRIYAISALVVAAFYCIKTNNKYIWSGTQ